MWSYAANRYKHNPIVAAYDIMCEPNSNEAVLSSGDPPEAMTEDEFYPTHAGTLADFNTLAAQVVPVIRAVDSQTPIIVGVNGFSAVRWLPFFPPLSGERLVYGVHQYAPEDFTHQEIAENPTLPITYPGMLDLDWDGTPETPFDQAFLAGVADVMAAYQNTNGVAIVANEWAPIRYLTGSAQYFTDMGDLFDLHGINNAMWSWDSDHETDDPTITWNSWNFRHGTDPANHVPVTGSDLQMAIETYWGRNTARPSNWTGGGGGN